jgi:GT2 family glycosyltransferase
MIEESNPEQLDQVQKLLSTPLIDEELCLDALGAPAHDLNAARLYLTIPSKARPRISYFFDRDFYCDMNPDVVAAAVDPLIHFLRYGCGECRSPHPLINFDFMRSRDPFVFSDSPTVSQLYDALCLDLVDPGPYFSREFYKVQIPKGIEIRNGLLAHFLSEGIRHGLRPNPFLDVLWYYRQLDGAHDVTSGLRHFIVQGDQQGYAPSEEFNATLYLERNQDVAAAGIPPLLHYLTWGINEGRPYFPLAVVATRAVDSSKGETDERTLGAESFTGERYWSLSERLRQKRQEISDTLEVAVPQIVDLADPGMAIAGIELPYFKSPKVSILIPAYNESKYTAECITSIVHSKPRVSYEVILADDASPDSSSQAFKSVAHLKFIRQVSNVGFLRNCNSTFHYCKGQYVLLLNNDAQLMPGALDAMTMVLDDDPEVAAVGPKILYPNGRLQEAGCTVSREGNTVMVGLFSDPAIPKFNYGRAVQYCSGAALLIRRDKIGRHLFDESFLPAYCEDVDLCLKLLSNGNRIIYCPDATVVHHLSVSMNKHSAKRRLQVVTRNQQKLNQKWSTLLDDINKVRVLAFYLPQFYPTPENDFYWGKGFTEWANVVKATPAYVGHYQPHLPTDLGFYDLRVKQTMTKQTLLARRYGMSGFCVYYYNFGDRRALDKGFEAMVSDHSIDFPYCVCWANENWTRHWDGGTKAIIFEQKYDLRTLTAVINDAIRYAADPRYIRVDGRALILVYRPLLIPNPEKFAALCRRRFRKANLPDPYLVYVESMETAEKRPRPADLGFDACVEFPPQGLAVPASTAGEILRDGFVGARYDYEETVLASLTRRSVPYKRHSAVFPSWDNTPRQPAKGDSFINATPEAFQFYVEQKLDEVINMFIGDERLLFVNAWNEWAEGTHLEPDRRFGHRWLEAVRNALLVKSLT